jgi:hypothetical protein
MCTKKGAFLCPLPLGGMRDAELLVATAAEKEMAEELKEDG